MELFPLNALHAASHLIGPCHCVQAPLRLLLSLAFCAPRGRSLTAFKERNSLRGNSMQFQLVSRLERKYAILSQSGKRGSGQFGSKAGWSLGWSLKCNSALSPAHQQNVDHDQATYILFKEGISVGTIPDIKVGRGHSS